MSNCLYFPNDKHPIVTVEKSITVLKIKSNMSELKTKGMKKLNNVKSNPNNKQPRINALFIKLLCLIYLLNQRTCSHTLLVVTVYGRQIQ